MRILHIDLKRVNDDVVELRSFEDNPNAYRDERTLALSDIAPLLTHAEESYYVSPKLQEDLSTIGRQLFNWLDGDQRWLVSRLSQYPGEPIVLAIATVGRLAHLPWEVLHDGSQFLVQRMPAVVPVRWQSSDAIPQLMPVADPQNRALRVLFMATSPRNVEPVLDYEQEEAEILTATARPSIGLTVEESGCLEGLSYLVDSYGKSAGSRYFDVVHLTGHATLSEGAPRFITESATGDAVYASAREIAAALRPPLPPLVFLSGCRTGQSGNAGAVPSMAEQLLQMGAIAVLGWGQNVLDTNATQAAATLYEALSRAHSVAEALAQTYQALIEQQARDWHLLRLYVAKTLPGALIHPERTPGWQRAPRPSMTTAFLDPKTNTIKVPTRESFVGRRRHLQNCLRSLTQSPDSLGVWIHGMGGLGKSSLAARLCDRLPQFTRLVWQGQIDEAKLVKTLAEAVDDPALRQRLQAPPQQEALRYRLRGVFTELARQGNPPFLLVLDDFEENLEPRDAQYILKEKPGELLRDLIWAIRQGDPRHRLIITSRYDVEPLEPQALYRQPLDALHGADLEKKCNRLSALKPPELAPNASDAERQAAEAQRALQKQIKALADGNPRLLEFLSDNVLTQSEAAMWLSQLKQNPGELIQKVAEARLLNQINHELRRILSQGLIYDIPVPTEAFITVAFQSNSTILEDVTAEKLQVAISLGLIEVSADRKLLRVSKLLPIELPENATALYSIAAQVLYELWWVDQTLEVEAQALEILRLSLIANNLEIAANVGHLITNHWNHIYRHQEAVQLCKDILQIGDDYRILKTFANAEFAIGEIENALTHSQMALELCPDRHKAERAAILSTQINLFSIKGEHKEASMRLEEALSIFGELNDTESQVAILQNLAGILLGQGWLDEATKMLQQALQILGDGSSYKILSKLTMIALMREDYDRADELLNVSIEQLNKINDPENHANALHLKAKVLDKRGEDEAALRVWENSLMILERINCLTGMADVLQNMARVLANQNTQASIRKAMSRWNEALTLYECLKNSKGKASILSNKAFVLFRQGEFELALTMLRQAIKIYSNNGLFLDLFTAIGNLSVADEKHSLVYLAQGLWIGLNTEIPLARILQLVQVFFVQALPNDSLKALLATTALYLCQTREQDHPCIAGMQQTSIQLLVEAAALQGVQLNDMEALENWMAQQQLNAPEVFLPALIQRLEAMIGDTWLFDPQRVG